MERVGRFWFQSGSISPLKLRRLREIHVFFDGPMLDRMLIPVVMQTYSVSLRLLDYTMTNWAKKTRVMSVMNTRSGPVPLNIFSLYKDWLHFYRRRGFDSFRRRERIYFEHTDGSGTVLESTVAQLNFLRWAEMYGIMEYVHKHKTLIEDDMMRTLSDSKRRRATDGGERKRRKRTELSQAPSTKCIIYPIKQSISFS